MLCDEKCLAVKKGCGRSITKNFDTYILNKWPSRRSGNFLTTIRSAEHLNMLMATATSGTMRQVGKHTFNLIIDCIIILKTTDLHIKFI